MSRITVGFVPRERFSLAPESLKSILDAASVPFELIVVDCNTPAEYWDQMHPLLRNRENTKIIRTDRYLLPNQCRNLVLEQASGEFICFIENDNLVDEAWLSRFLSAIEKHQADVIIPLIMEGRPGKAKVHFDEGLGRVREVNTPDGIKWEVTPRSGRKENDIGSASRPQEFMEAHCLFFRRSVFDRIGPFDGELSTSEEIDVSLALYAAKARCIFAPECFVHYVQPPQPVDPSDRGYFLTKWDIEHARSSHDLLVKKWNLVRPPQLVGWVEERNLKGSGTLHIWRDELQRLSQGRPFILVDMDEWAYTPILDGLRHIPFTEHEGQYWGAPADDDAAIAEFERQREAGARLIVFAWHAFWWFSYYTSFYELLSSRFQRIATSDHLVAFDLDKRV